MTNRQTQRQSQKLSLKRKQLLKPYLSDGLELPFAEFVEKYGNGAFVESLDEEATASIDQRVDWDMVDAQIEMLFDDEEQTIAFSILRSLNDRGFLEKEIKQLAEELMVHPDEVEAVRQKLMRQVEPFGLGSVNLEEFRNIVLELKLEQRETPIDSSEASSIKKSPDFILYQDGTRLIAQLNEKYEYLLQSTTGIYRVVAEYRVDLMNRLANLIAEECGQALLSGQMCFLTLDQAVATLGVSKSTVSRLVRSKTFVFNGELYDVSQFFVRSVKGVPQGELLREIFQILKERPDVTDKEISEILRLRKGWKFSRRTVNKYRNILRKYEGQS
jgi:RNA polymerase sigma-54 factor